MYIDIHLSGVHGDVEYTQGKLMLHQIFFVSVFHSPGNDIAADKSPVDKIYLKITVGPHLDRLAQIPFQANPLPLCADGHKGTGHLPPVDTINYFP